MTLTDVDFSLENLHQGVETKLKTSKNDLLPMLVCLTLVVIIALSKKRQTLREGLVEEVCGRSSELGSHLMENSANRHKQTVTCN